MNTFMRRGSKAPRTLQEAMIYYASEENCLAELLAMRWPNGVSCPRCGDMDVTRIKPKTSKRRRTIWKCNGCKRQFSATIGTIFEDSKLPLSKWFPAFWQLLATRNGTSSCELARSLGITQKTAWFVLHRVRECIASNSVELATGEVEVDESFIGGAEKNKHVHKKLKKGRGTVGKAIVIGFLQRGDQAQHSQIVKAALIPNRKRETLHSKIHETIAKPSNVYTDAFEAYREMPSEYAHEFVNHTTEYVRGKVHTNGLENFWSQLAKCLVGTYVSVQDFHLQRYVDEQVFRFNFRKSSDRWRFLFGLRMIEGKRLKYERLVTSYERHRDEFGVDGIDY